MKRIIALFLITFSFFTCKREAQRPRFPNWGFVTATANGEPWLTFMTNTAIQQPWSIKIYGYEGSDRSDHPCNQNTFSINMRKFNPDGFMREALSFGKIPAREGTYLLKGRPGPCNIDTLPAASFNTSQDDGDVGKDVYRVLQTESSWLTVSSYDPTTQEIKGTFSVTFIMDYKSPSLPVYPDTVRFTNGSFHTKILQKRNQ